jgi:hypothetical protein
MPEEKRCGEIVKEGEKVHWKAKKEIVGRW